MKTRLAVFANADDVLLVWTADVLDDRCDGFAIQRDRGQGPQWLDNFAPPGVQPHQSLVHQTSAAFPFRRFEWTDHEVGTGDTVRYRVVPVIAGKPVMGQGSRWSAKRTLGAPSGPFAAFFNRGFVLSQFMSRYLDEHFPGLDRDKALEAFKKEVGRREDDIRTFLSGGLRTALLELLAGGGEVHAALFELNDDELVDALAAFGPRAHVVLANGSIQARKGESSVQARKRDENAAARKRLVAAGVDVSGRFVSPGALAHNKFLVSGDKVWTGSTNWTTTGLCTQLNNALLIQDAGVAGAYLKQWSALRDAGDDHPPALAAANGTPADHGSVSVHFSRAAKQVDLAALDEIVAGATQGVLFLMFVPGGGGVVSAVRALAAAQPGVLLRGVISQLPDDGGSTVDVTLFGDPSSPTPIARTFDVVQPQGFDHVAAGWAVETTRQQFLGHIGQAIIHSKVLVVDPFTKAPTVVTGSHNFSVSASESNDENFVVVRGDRALAEAYAVHLESAWRHYAARIGAPHADLMGIEYLRALLADQRGELGFWGLRAGGA